MHLQGLALFSFLTLTTAQAGVVQPDMHICGTTMHYREYGLSVPAIRGSNGIEIEDEVFRLKGVMGVGLTPKITALLSATELDGISLCAKGAVETIQKRGKIIYNFYPKSFEINEDPQDYLNPSDIPGFYVGSARNGVQSYPAAFSVVPRNDFSTETRVFIPTLIELMSSLYQSYCPSSMLSNPFLPEKASGFRLLRTDKDTLSNSILLNCDSRGKVRLTVAFVRAVRQDHVPRVLAHIVLERPAKTQVLRIDLERTTNSN